MVERTGGARWREIRRQNALPDRRSPCSPPHGSRKPLALRGAITHGGGRWTGVGIGSGLPQDGAYDAHEDGIGRLWIATESGIFVRAPGADRFHSTGHEIGQQLSADAAGTLWVTSPKTGYRRLDGQPVSPHLSVYGQVLLDDRTGTKWVGTAAHGVWRLPSDANLPTAMQQITAADGLSSDNVRALFEDREGSLWIGTEGGGLNRLKDGMLTAFTTADGLSNDLVCPILEDRDRNLWISRADGSGELAITTDGSLAARTKYGVGSWVYGEELGQTTAIWWSPDGSKVGFYRFDESKVKDYYLQLGQTDLQSVADIEAYPKAGTDNPVADVLVYDVAAKRVTKIDVRTGRPFSNDVVGHYAYNVRWSPDGSELTMHRTNRRQQILEFVACSPATGASRRMCSR